MKQIVEIDDFHTSPWLLNQTVQLKKEIPNLHIHAFFLLGLCDSTTLNEFNQEHSRWFTASVHGWFHGSEHRWGYWHARNFFEIVDSFNVFSKLYKSPWNKLPRVGFLRALKEHEFSYITPVIAQAFALRVFKIPHVLSGFPVLHPFQLRNLDAVIEILSNN